MSIKKVLIVDDEPLIRSFLQETLRRQNLETLTAENGKIAIDILKEEAFDLIITDMQMPQNNGLDVLKFAKAHHPNTIVIIITAFGSIDNAVEAMQWGAFNYLIKPFSADSIETILKKVDEHLSLLHENKALKQEIASYKNFKIIAESSYMQKILQDVEKIAISNAPVFISGESGTGKEVIAHLIHYHSKRAKKPFIKVNCAAIAETLLESEFFGHEKGSFTGALEQKKGRFELAHDGTLLLDEVTEIPLNLQPKLLRAVQEQEFERVGGTKPIKVDVRLIATSNRNMKEAIEKNIFREDLFYRLNVVPIHILPLRQRSEDILSLAKFFLEKFCLENHKPIKIITPEAEQKLIGYSWPGNVRELANIIERTVVMDLGDMVLKEHLVLDTPIAPIQTTTPIIKGRTMSEIEKEVILDTLKQENNNRTKAAKVLGISLRTLRNKIKLYALKTL
ncbi:MAG: sigma-54-dependent Fis family transcriptional regulator [Chlamydiae bacterium]|nr:sigma-54-dependent Fis family transcriptional regulator [Chlamydiota bacterium]